ncbi:MAG: hypothetical protein ABFR63_05050 [Thermodesulfobacteriota bacterium]
MKSAFFSLTHLFPVHALLFFLALPTALLLLPTKAYAVQSHSGTEGLLTHQIGHFLFFTGMLVLLYRVKQNRLHKPGWPEFTRFLYIILFWNILTFSGHWLHEYIRPEQFVRHGHQTIGLQVDTASDLIFYLSRLDHLLLVPAIFMLFLAIRKWGQNQ